MKITKLEHFFKGSALLLLLEFKILNLEPQLKDIESTIKHYEDLNSQQHYF